MEMFCVNGRLGKSYFDCVLKLAQRVPREGVPNSINGYCVQHITANITDVFLLPNGVNGVHHITAPIANVFLLPNGVNCEQHIIALGAHLLF